MRLDMAECGCLPLAAASWARGIARSRLGKIKGGARPVALNGGGRQRRCSGDSGAAQMGMVHHPLTRAMALLTRQTLPGRNQPADQVKLAVRSSIRCWKRWSREVDKGRGCGEAVDKGG